MTIFSTPPAPDLTAARLEALQRLIQGKASGIDMTRLQPLLSDEISSATWDTLNHPRAWAEPGPAFSLAAGLLLAVADEVNSGSMPLELAALQTSLEGMAHLAEDNHLDTAGALWVELGRYHANLGNYPLARDVFDRALRVDETSRRNRQPARRARFTLPGDG